MDQSSLQHLKSEMAIKYCQNRKENLEQLVEKLNAESWFTLLDVYFIKGYSPENVEEGVNTLVKAYDTFLKDYPKAPKDVIESLTKNPLDSSKIKSNLVSYNKEKHHAYFYFRDGWKIMVSHTGSGKGKTITKMNIDEKTIRIKFWKGEEWQKHEIVDKCQSALTNPENWSKFSENIKDYMTILKIISNDLSGKILKYVFFIDE